MATQKAGTRDTSIANGAGGKATARKMTKTRIPGINKIVGGRTTCYAVRVELPRDPITGKRKQRTEVFPTMKAAEAAHNLKLAEIERGGAIDATKMTTGEYLVYWLDTYVAHNVKATTLTGYRVCVKHRIVPALGSTPLVKLTVAQLQGFYMGLLTAKRADGRPGTLSPRTVRLTHTVLREALQHAVEWGMIVRNVADATKPPRAVRPQVQVWDSDEVGQFLQAAATEEHNPLWLVAVMTGMRRGELLGLRWQDVDLTAGVLHVRHTLTVAKGIRALTPPKTKSGRRTIPLPPSCLAALKAHRKVQAAARLAALEWADRDAVFTASNGGWLDPGNLSRAYDRLVVAAKVKRIRFHDLRHTSATLLLKQGVNPKVVSERLGHATISITLDTYSHVLPSMQREAADALETALFGAVKGETEGDAAGAVKQR